MFPNDIVNASEVFLDRVGAALRRLDVQATGMVVAVSGGPDSVALLHALLALRGDSPPPLVIAHVNHQLRGAESDEDQAFVHYLGLSLIEQGVANVSQAAVRLEVAAQASATGENLEAVARQERYRWLANLAWEHGLGLVATGHTADDQAETVLHRLMRGTGLQGLRGIAAKRALAEGVELVRPMLAATRAEVMGFLEDRRVAARQDSSNADLKYTRNRIRHRLLPLIEQEFNPAIRSMLRRLAEEATETFESEHEAVRELLGRAELPRAGALLVFDSEPLGKASRRRVRLLFRWVWQREGWDASGMRRQHWKRLEAVVFDGLTAVDLPGRIHARQRGGVVQLAPRSANVQRGL